MYDSGTKRALRKLTVRNNYMDDTQVMLIGLKRLKNLINDRNEDANPMLQVARELVDNFDEAITQYELLEEEEKDAPFYINIVIRKESNG